MRLFTAAGRLWRTIFTNASSELNHPSSKKEWREKEDVTVVAVSGTAAKVDAIRTALRAKWVDVLITDEYTAKELAADGAKD